MAAPHKPARKTKSGWAYLASLVVVAAVAVHLGVSFKSAPLSAVQALQKAGYQVAPAHPQKDSYLPLTQALSRDPRLDAPNIKAFLVWWGSPKVLAWAMILPKSHQIAVLNARTGHVLLLHQLS